MNAKNVKKEFLRYAAGRGESLPKMTPSRALESMLSFYGDIRADECDVAGDGDMLLFQWGTYDWGDGDHFELDITRQFVFGGGEDEDIWQFHVTFRFATTEGLANLASGQRWCRSLEDLSDFTLFVRQHPASVAVG